MTCGCPKMKKGEGKRLQGVRKPRKDAEMAWPDWEEARNMEESEWRLKPEGEAEVPEIIIVSHAVENLVSLCQAVQHKNPQLLAGGVGGAERRL